MLESNQHGVTSQKGIIKMSKTKDQELEDLRTEVKELKEELGFTYSKYAELVTFASHMRIALHAFDNEGLLDDIEHMENHILDDDHDCADHEDSTPPNGGQKMD